MFVFSPTSAAVPAAAATTDELPAILRAGRSRAQPPTFCLATPLVRDGGTANAAHELVSLLRDMGTPSSSHFRRLTYPPPPPPSALTTKVPPQLYSEVLPSLMISHRSIITSSFSCALSVATTSVSARSSALPLPNPFPLPWSPPRPKSAPPLNPRPELLEVDLAARAADDMATAEAAPADIEGAGAARGLPPAFRHVPVAG